MKHFAFFTTSFQLMQKIGTNRLHLHCVSVIEQMFSFP